MLRPEPWGKAVRRRDFVSLIVARRSFGDPEDSYLAAFVEGLRKLGWTEGQNVRIDTRWGAGGVDDIRKYAAELSAAP
jgi:hypothetical protein